MSFILDALKKAESERSRNLGPVLMDVRIAPSRQRLPSWAWVLGGVLLANLLVLAWLLLRKPSAAPAEIAASVAASVAPRSSPAEVQPAAVPPTAVAIAPAAPPVEPPTPVAQPMLPPPASPIIAAALPVMPVMPAVTLPDQPPPVDNLPTMQDLVASGVTLPTLQLSLHVYDDAPGGRYILLNSRRMREGDELPDGTRIERITPQGVVLNAQGRRFLLPAGG